MTPVHAILIVIIRLWAAGVIITSSLHLSIWPFLDTGANNDPSNYAFLTFLNAGIWVFLGCAAWIFAPNFANVAYKPDDVDPKVSIKVDAETLVQIGSFLIGGFYLAAYAPQLFVDLGWWFVSMAGQGPVEEGQEAAVRTRNIIEWRNTISNLFVIGVACFMALRPSYLAKLFTRLRKTGHDEKNKGTEE